MSFIDMKVRTLAIRTPGIQYTQLMRETLMKHTGRLEKKSKMSFIMSHLQQ